MSVIEKQKIPFIAENRIAEATKEINKERKTFKYNTKSLAVWHLVERFVKNKIFVPDYQRDFVWDKRKKTAFVESILLDLPIPSLFLVEDSEGKYEIVDGSQRIRTLVDFVKNKFALDKPQKLKTLDGFFFDNLGETPQDRFLNTTITSIILDDETSQEARNELFERLNTFEPMEDMELRRGIYKGAFNNLVMECGKILVSEKYKNKCPISEHFKHRKEEEELVLRFFAFSETYKNGLVFQLEFNNRYGHTIDKNNMGMRKFLDLYYRNKNYYLKGLSEQDRNKEIIELKNKFQKMLDFVDKYFDYGFSRRRKGEYTSRFYFESISVGVAIALEENPDLTINNVAWITKDKEFNVEMDKKSGISQANRIKRRIEIVKNNLLKG